MNRASEELAHGAASMSRQEYKGYKKILQENVFNRLIEKMNVTLIELSKQMVTLELGTK